MRVAEMNWEQVAAYLQAGDLAVLPLGSTEQHAGLSLAVDSILAERVAVAAAEPLGVPVFPVLAYGITPYFLAYPGSVSLRVETYLRVIRDVLDSLHGQGFRRFFLCNGHGGNLPAGAFAGEWMADHPGTAVKLHNWWNAPETLAKVQAIDPVASHASWMENFPWTRLEGVAPKGVRKSMVALDRLRVMGPGAARDLLGDGNYGGLDQRPDDDMLAIWQVAVAETRRALEGPWG
jgi:creatinine amidohydrolase